MIRLFIVFIVALIILRFIFFFLFKPQLENAENISFTTTVLEEPYFHGKFETVPVVYKNFFGSQKIFLYFPQNQEITYGEKISVNGKIKVVKSRNISNQVNQLISENNNFFIYFPKIEVNKTINNPFLSLAYFIRQKTKEIFFNNLPDESANLLLGIVLGIRGNFSQSFLTSLRNSGVMHVVAASGMNVTLIGGLLLGIMGKFFTKRLSLVLSISGIMFYAVLAGLQPSIVRASIMISLVFVSQFFGRQYTSFYSLCITALTMIFISPELIFDIGFFLSIFSTLGIIFIKPLFPKSGWLEDISTTMSAQIATLPILLFGFGQYSLLSILVNALILWTVPILMILGGVAAIVQAVPFMSSVLLFFTAPLLWFFESVVSFFNNYSLSINITKLPLTIIFGYYILVFGVVWSLYARKHSVEQVIKNEERS